MPKFTLITPLDQPLGTRRLLTDLQAHLGQKGLHQFGVSVAFAKVGPLYKLQAALEAWRADKKTCQAVFGIDHRGTSKQALEVALDHFDEVYYTQYPGHSFHPKIYWFRGKTKGILFIGSNNLTVGGTEINFEAGIELTFKLPDEETEFDEALHSCWTPLLEPGFVATRKLDATGLAALDAAGWLLDEAVAKGSKGGFGASGTKGLPITGKLKTKPASSLPKGVFGKAPSKTALKKTADALAAQAKSVDITKSLIPVAGVAMQIRPHHNGEIFLSKLAAQQNPAFFGMPFTGKTTPKKAGNAAYPQRVPDPICNIVVIGGGAATLIDLPKYALNTVFYEEKAEIRVTAAPLVPHVPEYSIMVMTPSAALDVDYEVEIHTLDSPDYGSWLAICDQQMPGGGKTPRRFGWF